MQGLGIVLGVIVAGAVLCLALAAYLDGVTPW
jgi:hypothetical protein